MTDTAVDHWAVPWSGTLYSDEGVVTLNPEEGKEVYQWTEKFSERTGVTFHPGHTYRMGLTTRTTGDVGNSSTHLRSYWGASVAMRPSSGWTTWTGEFTLPAGSETSISEEICFYISAKHAGAWMYKDLRVEDLTAENASRGGVSVHDDRLTWRQIGFTNDGDTLVYTSHGVAVTAGTEIQKDDTSLSRTYPKALHAEPNSEYVVTLDMRLTGTEPKDSWRGIGLMLDGAGWVSYVWHIAPGGWKTYTGIIRTHDFGAAEDVGLWINTTDPIAGNRYELRNLTIAKNSDGGGSLTTGA